MCSPSKSIQTGVTCGEPSGINVTRLAKIFLSKRSLYLLGITSAIFLSLCRFQAKSFSHKWKRMSANGGRELQNNRIIKTRKEIREYSCSFVAEPTFLECLIYSITA